MFYSVTNIEIINSLYFLENNLKMIEVHVKKIIDNMRKKYKCFVSERHLQVAFAIELANVIKGSKLYPEFVFASKNNMHIDLIADINGKMIAFEFKYITCYFEDDVDGRHIKLRNHSAIDVRRYDCLSDISRLEKLKHDKDINEGYFYLITNMQGFWFEKNNNKDTVDADFRFNKRITEGIKRWSKIASKGTIKHRDAPIKINNNYDVIFEDYYKFEFGKGHGNFKQLLIRIK